jgi:hypothetical protein
VISNASRPDERRTVTTLEHLSFGAARGDDRAPTLIMIGAALAQRCESHATPRPAARAHEAFASL